MFGLGQMPAEQEGDAFLAHAAALLEDAIVHAPFDLEENRRIGVRAVVTQPQLVAVLVSVDRGPIEFQVVRVHIEAMDRIGIVGFADAVFVEVNVTANKITNEQGSLFGDEVLQLEALLLHPISSHRLKGMWTRLCQLKRGRNQLLSTIFLGARTPDGRVRSAGPDLNSQ